MDIITIASMLFFIINPLGNTPFIVSLLAKFDLQAQRRILIRELILGFLLALFFIFAGEHFLSLLAIDETTIGICGGVILFLIALSLIFPKVAASEDALLTEPCLVPIATPVLAGPCLLTGIMLFSHQVESLTKS